MAARPLTAFSIESVKTKGKRIIVLGHLSFMDITECVGSPRHSTSLRWWADSVSIIGKLIKWKVFQRIDKGQSISAAVAAALRKFVTAELEIFIKSNPNIFACLKLKAPYTGPCVCGELDGSSSHRPFDWKGKTGGVFPERCFECSCGARWWCNRPSLHSWVRIADYRAWLTLYSHNGVTSKRLADTGHSGVYLWKTLIWMRLKLPYYLHTEEK